jgi:hypothetical protein
LLRFPLPAIEWVISALLRGCGLLVIFGQDAL